MGTSSRGVASAALQEQLTPPLQALGYDLVLLEWVARQATLRLYIDRWPTAEQKDEAGGACGEGITLSDCQKASKLVEDILDGEALMPEALAYSLEVSSPGLERPLCRPRDFARFVGHPVRLRLRAPLAGHGSRVLDGELADAGATGVTLQIDQQRWPIAFDAIEKARLRLL